MWREGGAAGSLVGPVLLRTVRIPFFQHMLQGEVDSKAWEEEEKADREGNVIPSLNSPGAAVFQTLKCVCVCVITTGPRSAQMQEGVIVVVEG